MTWSDYGFDLVPFFLVSFFCHLICYWREQAFTKALKPVVPNCVLSSVARIVVISTSLWNWLGEKQPESLVPFWFSLHGFLESEIITLISWLQLGYVCVYVYIYVYVSHMSIFNTLPIDILIPVLLSTVDCQCRCAFVYLISRPLFIF